MAAGSSAEPRRLTCLALCIGVLCSLADCAPPQAAACPAGLGAPMQMFTLFFGQSISGRNDLTDQEWRTFLDGTVTANLPNGYTVQDAYGAWMNPMTRQTIKEPSKVIIVAMPDSPDSLAAINRIRNDYQVRFHQQSVGMTVSPTCGSF